MRGLLLNDSLPAHARHLWSSLHPGRSSTHRCLWGTTRRGKKKKAGVEFISLKITKQRPSGGLVCSLSLPVKTCLKWSAWKTCITARGITPGGEKRENTKLFASVLGVTQAMPWCFLCNMIYRLTTPAFLLHFSCPILSLFLRGTYGQCNFYQHLIWDGCCPSSFQSVYITR